MSVNCVVFRSRFLRGADRASGVIRRFGGALAPCRSRQPLWGVPSKSVKIGTRRQCPHARWEESYRVPNTRDVGVPVDAALSVLETHGHGHLSVSLAVVFLKLLVFY